MLNNAKYHKTDYGFQYGSVEVERQYSRDDCVYMTVKTPKIELLIYATKGGKMRFFRGYDEYVLVKKDNKNV